MTFDPNANNGHQQDHCSTNIPVGNGVATIVPRVGRLVALRTKAEVDHDVVQTARAYVVKVPQKSANEVLKSADTLIREHATTESINIQHLRRIVKQEHLPVHLKHAFACEYDVATYDSADGPLHLYSTVQTSERPEAEQLSESSLYILVAPTTSLSILALSALLASLFPSQTPRLYTIKVPLHPPTTASQAQEWSSMYWPTVYKKHNPFGPQPSLVAKAESELLPSAGTWMALALNVGRETRERGYGIGAGAVIVENGRAVVAAGDGRWASGKPKIEADGNPMAHAVMRAIALVATKRRQLLAHTPTSSGAAEVEEIAGVDRNERATSVKSYENPLTDLERQCLAQDSVEAGGYLCLDMDIFATHEPCVMCSMAILHSRFGRAVFGKQMPATGGLCTEVKEGVTTSKAGLGYGLFWRSELNWRLLAWRWQDGNVDDEEADGYRVLSENTHYHASDNYHLRLHRARSVILTDSELVEIRAAQRTFEGAYIRTALGQFSFALVILKIFTSEFYSIGALFAIYGTGILLTSLLRRQQGNKQFFSEVGEGGLNEKKFRTSGNVVAVLTVMSVAAYGCLLGLTLKLGD
ncbi:MAG: hypothetical protein Q9212_002434 [Teloschistes hypoglaucus]